MESATVNAVTCHAHRFGLPLDGSSIRPAWSGYRLGHLTSDASNAKVSQYIHSIRILFLLSPGGSTCVSFHHT